MIKKIIFSITLQSLGSRFLESRAEISRLWKILVWIQSWSEKIESDPVLICNIFENHQSDPVQSISIRFRLSSWIRFSKCWNAWCVVLIRYLFKLWCHHYGRNETSSGPYWSCEIMNDLLHTITPDAAPYGGIVGCFRFSRYLFMIEFSLLNLGPFSQKLSLVNRLY